MPLVSYGRQTFLGVCLKMSKITIIVEGPTEYTFVENVLSNYLKNKGVNDIKPWIIPTSQGHRGGSLKYSKIRKFIINHLHDSTNNLVTTMFDYYALGKDFPGKDSTPNSTCCYTKINYLEEQLQKDINNTRFIPYLQMHEFEATAFIDVQITANILSIKNKDEIAQKINKIISSFQNNPELINDSPNTAPSKRLKQIFPEYRKIAHGKEITQALGIKSIKDSCPHFRKWVELLESS